MLSIVEKEGAKITKKLHPAKICGTLFKILDNNFVIWKEMAIFAPTFERFRTIHQDMITKESIETAYCFLHQKLRVYLYSNMNWQKDDIEYAIASYVDSMPKELYDNLADGRTDFLVDHKRFADDMTKAVEQLERMLGI